MGSNPTDRISNRMIKNPCESKGSSFFSVEYFSEMDRFAKIRNERASNRSKTAEGISIMKRTIFGKHDDKTIRQFDRCLNTGNVVGGVLCADGHYGYSQPVGGVIVYDGQVSPSGVGYDIACGNKAVRTNLKYGDIKDSLPKIMASAQASKMKCITTTTLPGKRCTTARRPSSSGRARRPSCRAGRRLSAAAWETWR